MFPRLRTADRQIIDTLLTKAVIKNASEKEAFCASGLSLAPCLKDCIWQQQKTAGSADPLRLKPALGRFRADHEKTQVEVSFIIMV
jgi:hypothetical protein